MMARGAIVRGAVNIVGAGPTGALLAIFLRRRGLDVALFESRPDPAAAAGAAGRSINVALADRGIHALKAAGVYDDLAGALMAMRGRLIHRQDGTQVLHPYGRRSDEVIYSVSRNRLTQALLDEAAQRHLVDIKFEHRLEDLDFERGTAQIRDLRRARTFAIAMEPLLAADGAGSVTRRRMNASGLIDAQEIDLAHSYKELSIPAGYGGEFRLARDVLHIWPRGNFMLIALPNPDGSFTATLFLEKHGAVSFEALASPAEVERFLRSQFPDAYALMPDGVTEFLERPAGFLGTVYANQWNAGGMAGLIGDAAHAMVPFHGQGMNCCFEDCLAFDACLTRNATWHAVFEDFFAARKPNTDAIAAMALENHLEMRDRVADPKFRLQQMLALELERRHPQRFIPRYSMVTFHHSISYRTAWQRGIVQARLLAELTAGAATLDEVDYERAAREIERELPPLPRSSVTKL